MKELFKIKNMIIMALVAAIYVVSTIMLGSFGYGPIQFRISEILNLLAIFHPMYIIAVGIGCAIANLYSFGLIDVFVGSISTMVAMYFVHKFKKNLYIASIFPTIFTFTIALELMWLQGLPFWKTFLTIATGEFISVSIIGVIVFKNIKKNKSLVKLLSLEE